MTKGDAESMRNLMIFALAAMIAGAAIIPVEACDAENRPSELVALEFWNGITAEVVYVYPDKPIGDTPLPSLPGTATYWVRMDTGEIVTSETTFAPGSYLIEAYSWVPEPWGADNSGASGEPDNTLALVAIALSSAAIITGAVAILLVIRKK